MNLRKTEGGSMASSVGDSIPAEVRSALLGISRANDDREAPPSHLDKLPGMLRLDPRSFARAVSRMKKSRVDQARTTLKNALERAVEEHGDRLTPHEILDIVARADALLDVLVARREELELIAQNERIENERRQKEAERQRLATKAVRERSARTRPRPERARKTPAPAEVIFRRGKPAEPRRKVSIPRLYAGLDHLKLQARYMDLGTKQKLRQEIRAELEDHRHQARSYVRPDDSLELKAREVLAVLGDERALASKARTPSPLEPAHLRARTTIYPARGRTVSGGLPSLGRRS
ncbi:hypothetical protein [Brachybacterium paraconglomeratum]|uniref:hypothetical protein n=1 Tax=Brachybacterium paraconglomeratum TaxID=173362 RepID=UPI003FD20F35